MMVARARAKQSDKVLFCFENVLFCMAGLLGVCSTGAESEESPINWASLFGTSLFSAL